MTHLPKDSPHSLEQQDQLITLLLENMTSAVLVEDENRRVIAANPRFCDMFGIPVEPSSLVGADCARMAQETAKAFVDSEDFLARVDELLRLQERCDADEVQMRDGRTLLRNFVPVIANGELKGLLWQYQDITRAKSTEALRHAMISGGLDSVIVSDHHGRILEVNDAAEAMFGFKSQDVLGKSMADVIVPDDLVDAHVAGMHRYHLTGEKKMLGKRTALRARRADGTEFPIELSVSRIGDFDPPRFLGFIRDTTRDEIQHDAIENARQVAESANRAKSQFLAAMSHEIRTPMNGIIGMTELTLDTALTGQQREYLQMVQRSASTLLSTINAILDFSKIEAGKMELEQIDFTLWETVTGTLKPLALLSRKKGIELLYEEGVDVPERLRGDPVRLRQALTNLVGNAVKFTESGCVRVSVDVATSDDDGIRLRFAVQDTGIGIREDKLDRIFGAFDQVDGTMSRRFGGTGLGLAITSGIVDLLGGTVEVDSEAGRGSTFSFEADFALPGEHKRPFAPRERDLSGIRVLVVDDYEPNLRIMEDFAECLGMVAVVASSGTEALTALRLAHQRGEPFQVALLDCHMPEMTGFELAEEIRGDLRFRDIMLIACTAAGEPGDGLRCEELGIQSYLLRPLAPAELRDAILMTLEKGEGPGLITRHILRETRQTLNVLLVEDNRVNQSLALHMLKKFGHTTDVAMNGTEAVEAAKSKRYDVILMDIQMPEMDGTEATRLIRTFEATQGRHTPVVAMTAYAMVGDREKFIAAGMDDYISKPISRERLREVLRGITPNPASSESESLPESLVDMALLEEQIEGDTELLRTLVSVFEEDQERLLHDLDAALSSGDAEGAETAAHTLKGALGVLGAQPVCELASQMEVAARENRLDDCRAAHARLRDSVLSLNKELERLLDTL